MDQRIVKMSALAALFTVAMAACSSGGTPSGNGSSAGSVKSLNGAGSTFAAPLYQKWGSVYAQAKGVQINYQPVGSGAGIQQITAKTVDFAGTDAPMKPEEEAAASGPILHIPTAFGAVVVTYNLPGVTKTLKFKPATLAGIFLGDIKKWNDPKIAADNAGVSLPATSISVAHRADGSGTTNIFTSYLTAVSPKWSSKVGAGKTVEWPVGAGANGNDGVSGQVQKTAGGIGYVELAYAKKNNLPFADIQNSSGNFITPSLDSTTAAAAGAQVPDTLKFSVVNSSGAQAYPICGATWILVYQHQSDKAKGQAVVDFLWWGIHQGQQYEKDLLYAPLPDTLVTKAEDKIKTIDFNGTPLTPAS